MQLPLLSYFSKFIVFLQIHCVTEVIFFSYQFVAEFEQGRLWNFAIWNEQVIHIAYINRSDAVNVHFWNSLYVQYCVHMCMLKCVVTGTCLLGPLLAAVIGVCIVYITGTSHDLIVSGDTEILFLCA